MNKTRTNELIRLADDTLKKSNILNKDKISIAKTYDGKIAGLSVSLAMSNLLPTLAFYYQDFDENNPTSPCGRNVLNVVAQMVTDPESGNKFGNAMELITYAINKTDNSLKQEVIDCAIALKQVVRTYSLV